VSTDSIQDLPLGGRDVLPFAQLVSGAQVGGDLRFTTYNSMPNGAINISVDGTNNNFQRFRTSTTGFFEAAALRLGAIDEVTVSTSDLTADSGAEGGATLKFTIKRGTNQFHGSGFWEAYNSAFNANSYQNDTYLYDAHQLCPSGFTSGVCNNTKNDPDPGTAAGYLAAGRKQPNHTNDFGGNIGGPILKNKLFFFVNFEFENQPGSANFTEGVLTSSAAQGVPACPGSSEGGAQNGCFTYTRADNGSLQTVNLYQVAAGAGFPSMPNANVQTLLASINTLAAGGKLAPNTTDAYGGTEHEAEVADLPH
jgi:hypothetical protein